jgi:phage terminase small subunit
MNSKIPANLHMVMNTPKQRRHFIATTELNCDWLSDPAAWNKEKFTGDIVTFIEQTQMVNAYPNMVLIGLLAHQIDLYVQCTRQMAQTGLVESYNKGATSGPSLYFSMADKALNRILQLMKELGLTPSHRIGTVKSTSPEALAFDEFMAGP